MGAGNGAIVGMQEVWAGGGGGTQGPVSAAPPPLCVGASKGIAANRPLPDFMPLLAARLPMQPIVNVKLFLGDRKAQKESASRNCNKARAGDGRQNVTASRRQSPPRRRQRTNASRGCSASGLALLCKVKKFWLSISERVACRWLVTPRPFPATVSTTHLPAAVQWQQSSWYWLPMARQRLPASRRRQLHPRGC